MSGKPLPPQFEEGPSLIDLNHMIVWRAFWELLADRYYPRAMIAWHSIRMWFDRAGCDEWFWSDFLFLVRALDHEYLRLTKPKERGKDGNPPGGGKKVPRPRRYRR